MRIQNNGLNLCVDGNNVAVNTRRFTSALVSTLVRDGQIFPDNKIIATGFDVLKNALKDSAKINIPGDEVMGSLTPYNGYNLAELGLYPQIAKTVLFKVLEGHMESNTLQFLFEEQLVDFAIKNGLFPGYPPSEFSEITDIQYAGNTMFLQDKGLIVPGVLKPIDPNLEENFTICGSFDEESGTSTIIITHIGGFDETVTLELPFHGIADDGTCMQSVLFRKLRLPPKPDRIYKLETTVNGYKPSRIQLPVGLRVPEDDHTFTVIQKEYIKQINDCVSTRTPLNINGLAIEPRVHGTELDVTAVSPFNDRKKIVTSIPVELNEKGKREAVEITVNFEPREESSYR